MTAEGTVGAPTCFNPAKFTIGCEQCERFHVVICGSPDPDPNPEKLLNFTPDWQSGAKVLGVRESERS
jgi:hypothetical protein